jgi:DNA-binding transcriptional MerR regulator
MADNLAGGFKSSDPLGARRPGKSASAFRTISEVATDLNVPQHVLRFWETRFAQIRPLKRAGGRRYYRPEDVELLRRIRELLYNSGYTIKGVQRLLRDAGRRPDGEEVAEIEGEGEAEIDGPLDVAPDTAEAELPKAMPVRTKSGAIEAAINDLLAIRELLRRPKR